MLTLAGCGTIVETQDQHSEDYELILETLKEACKARQTERWKEFLDQYSYDEESFEYKDLKRIMIKAFNIVNAADCEFEIEEITFNKAKTKAELKGRFYITEIAREGFGIQSDIQDIPNEEGNPYEMVKKDGDWKICPFGKNCDGKFSPLYSCQNGAMIDNKFDCPFEFRKLIDVSEEKFNSCFFNEFTDEQILPKKLGDFRLNDNSIKIETNTAKLYENADGSIDRFEVLKSIEGDYQQTDYEHRIFNMEYIQLGDLEDLKRYVAVVRQIDATLAEANQGIINKTSFGDVEALYSEFKSVPRTQKLTTITRRYYIFFPDTNTVLRFYFNDWLTQFNAEHIISNYLSNRCNP